MSAESVQHNYICILPMVDIDYISDLVGAWKVSKKIARPSQKLFLECSIT